MDPRRPTTPRAGGRRTRLVRFQPRALLLLMFSVSWLTWARPAAADGCILPDFGTCDPHLTWYTVRTPHYRVHYHGGLEAQAQRLAGLAELLRERLGNELAYRPREIVDVVLTDLTDDANGEAQVVPHDLIKLYATGPDDMSLLGDYDDWLVALFTHEHAHVSNLDNVSGLPALVNALLGKTFAPNEIAPRWIIEGVAVALESKYSSGGRLRSTQFDMYLRADVLENNLARLDEMGNFARRWPDTTLWYLYGGKFVEWIESVYGPDVFAAVAADYGASLIPWGVNRAIRRVTGRTYEELYKAWTQFLAEKYRAQALAVRARGLRQGTRLTWRGRRAGGPRLVPACARRELAEELVYYRDDGHSTAGLYRLPLSSSTRTGEAELWARAGTTTAAAFDTSCNLIFHSPAPSRRNHWFNDLIRQLWGTTSPRGIEGSRQRLTVGARAHSPEVSPDGRRIVYVTNRAGTSTLRIADYRNDGTPAHERALVPSGRYEQVYTPRFSPDGRSVAYSVWTRGGYRDVRVVEIATGRVTAITHDRAHDQQPTWSTDGKTLFFVSDRTQIANIYAYELPSGVTHQVTNVISGAYSPELASDGKTLYYLGYTSAGFDLYALPLEPREWLPALAYREARPSPMPEAPARRWPVERYSAWETLRPYAYRIDYGPGTWGPTLSVSATGRDAAELHLLSAAVSVDTRQHEPSVGLAYYYNRLPAGLGIEFLRQTLPRKGRRYGDQSTVVIEHSTRVSSSVQLPIPTEFAQQTIVLEHSLEQFTSSLPVGDRADPYALITTEPRRGFLSTLRLQYGYTNAESSLYGISPEKGLTVWLGSELAAYELGSEFTSQLFRGLVSGYVPMPWGRHQVLALAVSGGSASGNYPRYFYTGGFVGIPNLDYYYLGGAPLSGFVLRGYEPTQFLGTHYNLYNAEFRFPLLYADRGVSTLPVFLRTLSGVVFADFGGAFDRLDASDPWDSYHLGLGAELWLELWLGYASGALRLGYARGTDSKAPHGGQAYAVVAASF